MNHVRHILSLILFPAIATQSVAQDRSDRFDHVLNRKGQSKITLATGIPYIGIAEYAYGISNKTTAGVVFGITPFVEGYGIRVRTILHERDNYRVYFCVPVLYYPKTQDLGGDPWWLTRPNINFEWMNDAGFRYKVGGSIVAAASHHTLFGESSNAKFAPGLWNAVHGGISLPVGPSLMFQAEASLVLKGVQVPSQWVGGPPVILVLGISYTF
ncbi:MAG: hypothetical protein KF749_05300 [Bacteroidetes bacterium]|nr:hypothetical protein [Bacteroidota bacterium]MCW5896446.1 hypothetical protein [Bacteroidota bacterium]